MKPSRPKIASLSAWLLAVLVSSANFGAADGRAPVLVVEVSEADQPAAQRFLTLSEALTERVRLPEAREPSQALRLAREAGARQVVIFDQAMQRVVVLRSDDGAQWTRSTAGADATPFVAAFVAVELLHLSVVSHAPPAAPAVRSRWGPTWLAMRIGLDALATAPYAGSIRPRLGLLGAFGHAEASRFLWLELSTAPYAQREHSLGAGRLQLTRTDLTARAGALWQHRRFGVATFGEAGAALIDARYRGPTPRDAHHAAVVAGLGAEPNLQLWPWLRLYASAVVNAVAPRGDYRVGGQSALREPRFGVQLGAGMWLALPIR